MQTQDGGSNAYEINMYRLVWNFTNGTAWAPIYIHTSLNWTNVVFTANFTTNSTGGLLDPRGSTFKLVNCTAPSGMGEMFRTSDGGTIKLTNCYGAFTSGFGTVDSNWDYQTNYITSDPQVDTSTYQILENASVWKNVGTGENGDGSQASLGVYGGQYSWASDIKVYQMGDITGRIHVTETKQIQIIDKLDNYSIVNENDWTWSSSNNAVATVDQMGNVTGISPGVVTINAQKQGTNIILSKKVVILNLGVDVDFTEIYDVDEIIYVDAINGDNTTGDGSELNPYKTLDKISETGRIVAGKSYSIMLASGDYDLKEAMFNLNCNKKINIVGDMENTRLIVTTLFPNNNPGGSKNYKMNFYRLIWYGTSTASNPVRPYTSMDFHNVVFDFSFSECGFSHFDPPTGAKYSFYNCIMPKYVKNVLRTTDGGAIELTNCYGGFTNGFGTTQDTWDYKTNYVTQYPSVDYEDYTITDDENVWCDVGTGQDIDGTIADLGLYGGDYTWTYNLDGTTRKKYAIKDYRNEYIKQNTSIQLEIINKYDPVTDADESSWTWTSSNPDIASVSSQGKVTGLSVGHTTITAKSANGLKLNTIFNVYRDKQDAITTPQVVQANAKCKLVLKENGTVWAIGDGTDGCLGNGSSVTSRKEPIQVKISENEYLTDVRKIAAGNNKVFAMTKDGEVYGWGKETLGELGNRRRQV